MLTIWTVLRILSGKELCRIHSETAAVAWWLERPPREWEVVGSIPGRDRLVFKTGCSGFPIGAQDYGNSTTTSPPVSG